jgi:spore coat polysaccharide biosynthesis protein SpsF (cytidylyltransferase family)
MKIVAIIQARMGSSRLPNKVLMPVMGRPLLGWMLERVLTCPEINDVILATTIDPRDDIIADFAQSVGCNLYRGSEDDVLDRYYQAACTVMPDAVVRITADCPLLDPLVLGSLIREYVAGDFDFLSNSEPLPSTWPDGMDVSIIRFTSLKNAWQNSIKPSEREHVTFFFWNNPQIFRCRRVEYVRDLSKYRITIDYPEDFQVLRAIIEYFCKSNPIAITRLSMEEIIAFLDANPDVFRLNNKYNQGLGWLAALERDKQLNL